MLGIHHLLLLGLLLQVERHMLLLGRRRLLGAAGVDLSDPAPAITPVVGVLAMPVGVVVLLLGAGDTSGLGVTSCCGCCCCTTGMGCGGGCSIRTGEVITTGEVCGGGIVW